MADYKTISDLVSQINPQQKFNFKSVIELCSADDLDYIKSIFTIIKKYKDPNWQVLPELEIQGDIISLQSTIILLAERFGNVGTTRDADENAAKFSRSKVRLALKEAKKEFEDAGNKVKATLDDIDDAAYVLTEDMWKKQEEDRHVTNFIRFVYFSAKDLVTLLDRALGRIYKLIPDTIGRS